MPETGTEGGTGADRAHSTHSTHSTEPNPSRSHGRGKAHGNQAGRAHGRDSEHGWRDLAGNTPSQVGVGGALRARDVARPRPEDLAAAERDVVVVRRQWQPPTG